MGGCRPLSTAVSRLSGPIHGLVNRHFCAQVRDALLPKGDIFVGAISEYPAEFEPSYLDNSEGLEESLVELTGQSAIASSEPPFSVLARPTDHQCAVCTTLDQDDWAVESNPLVLLSSVGCPPPLR